MSKFKWGFWQVLYKIGTYSKIHIINDNETTACGIYPEKMYLSEITPCNGPRGFDMINPRRDYCKRCIRIAKKEK